MLIDRQTKKKDRAHWSIEFIFGEVYNHTSSITISNNPATKRSLKEFSLKEFSKAFVVTVMKMKHFTMPTTPFYNDPRDPCGNFLFQYKHLFL